MVKFLSENTGRHVKKRHSTPTIQLFGNNLTTCAVHRENHSRALLFPPHNGIYRMYIHENKKATNSETLIPVSYLVA